MRPSTRIAVEQGHGIGREWDEDGQYVESREIGAKAAARRYTARAEVVCPSTSASR